MVTQEVTINNEVGLHARPATFFIQKANEFKSGIWVEKDERRVNAKSLLGVLSLGITKGTTITLLADGADEKEAVAAKHGDIFVHIEDIRSREDTHGEFNHPGDIGMQAIADRFWSVMEPLVTKP